MSLTICTVVYNEEKNLPVIEHNIRILIKKAPAIQILLIDNASTDLSTHALREFSAKYGVGYIKRVQNHLPQARQQALQLSKSQWVGFIDADCRIDEDWTYHVVQRISKDEGSIAGFGGPWQIVGESSDIYVGLFSTFLGHFGSDYLQRETSQRTVEHLPTANVIYYRKHALLVGGFTSPHPRVGEDLDLSCRLKKNGFELEIDPKLKIKHELPTSLRAWCAKMFLYGTARGEVMLRYGAINSYKSMVPILFFPFFLLIGLFSKLLLFVALAGYLLSCVFCSLNRSSLNLSFHVFLRMLATHVFYALGIFYGCKIWLQASLNKKLSRRLYKGPALEDTSV